MGQLEPAESPALDKAFQKCPSRLSQNLLIHSYPFKPAPIDRFGTPYSDCLVTAIGIGLEGAEMAQLLWKNQPGIQCYGLILDQEKKGESALSSLYLSITKSTFVFLLNGEEEEGSIRLSKVVSRLAKKCGVPVFGVVTCEEVQPSFLECIDFLFKVSSASLTEIDYGPASSRTIASYAGRHITQVLTDLFARRHLVCVDYNDFERLMQIGKVGVLGAGIASGAGAGRRATLLALERLRNQGVAMAEVEGYLSVMQGSSHMEIEDFEQSNEVLIDLFNDNDWGIHGLIQNDAFGYNIKVTLVVVS